MGVNGGVIGFRAGDVPATCAFVDPGLVLVARRLGALTFEVLPNRASSSQDEAEATGVCDFRSQSPTGVWRRRATRSTPHNIAPATVAQAAIMPKIAMAKLIHPPRRLSLPRCE